MTQEEKLTALKVMVGSSDSDEVLSTYLTFAGSKDYCESLSLPERHKRSPGAVRTPPSGDCGVHAEQTRS